MWRARTWRAGAVLVVGPLAVALVVAGCDAGPAAPSALPTGSASVTPAAPATTHPSPSPRATPAAVSTTCHRTVVVGYSVLHRAITACERGTPGGVALVLVGVIHGDERLGLGVVSRLRALAVPAGVDLWTIATVNPDGVAADTRQNAHRVDLNRNWPGSWQPSTPGSPTYGGPSAASEPETRAFRDFLLQLRPRTVVVMHSPLDAVDFSEGADPAVTRFLATASGYPARSLGARPGSFTGWFNAQAWGGTAVTFEFAASASTTQLSRVARALLELALWRRG